MNTLYQSKLMDHYRFSVYKHELSAPDFCNTVENTSCGDKITFFGIVCKKTATYKQLSFTGSGCVLSQALASIICQEFTQKPVEQLLEIDQEKYITAQVGCQLGMTRFKCAQLPLKALFDGVCKYLASVQDKKGHE